MFFPIENQFTEYIHEKSNKENENLNSLHTGSSGESPFYEYISIIIALVRLILVGVTENAGQRELQISPLYET